EKPRKRFSRTSTNNRTRVTSHPTPSRWFISAWARKNKRSINLSMLIRAARRITFSVSKSTRCSTTSAEIPDSKRWSRKSLRKNERAEFLRRAEAAQRLQGCGRVRRRRLGHCAGRDTDFSVPRNSELDCALGHHLDRNRISNRARDRMGV